MDWRCLLCGKELDTMKHTIPGDPKQGTAESPYKKPISEKTMNKTIGYCSETIG